MLLVCALAILPEPSPRGRGLGEGSLPPVVTHRRTLTPTLSLGERGPEGWRFAGEVRALVEWQGAPVAATAAGVFVRRQGVWAPLGTGSPAALVALATEGGELVGNDAAQRAYRLRNGKWQRDGTRAAGLRTPPALDAPPPGSKGAFLSATARGDVIRSYWGDDHLWKGSERWIARPPTEGDYALLESGNLLFAGTPVGVFAYDGKAWLPENLPGSLPLARPHGLVKVGAQWVVGGLQGLWMGKPGSWQEVGRVPVRQILGDGTVVWVLYGNGALDKLEPALDRHHPDVLHGAAKRPWGSCLGWASRTLLIGGDGGWVEKEGSRFVERYPPELRGQVVTAIVGSGDRRYVGTQKGGLFRFVGDRVSVFNPGNGLRDPWVTALSLSKERLLIGTSGAGLFSLRQEKIEPVASPSARPRSLAWYGDRLMVGAMDGAWIRRGNRDWEPLPVEGEEVTALADMDGKTVIITANGVHFPSGAPSSSARG